MAAARCSCGTAAIWATPTIPTSGFKKGDLKFILHGEKLQGSWVLVRMKRRPRRRQAHQLAADQAPRRVRETRARRTTSSTRTARSPRAGRWSRSPPARAGRRSRSCWRRRQAQGRRGLAFQPRRGGGSAGQDGDAKAGSRIAHGQSAQDGLGDAGFRRAAALRIGRTSAAGEGWCHEIKFDGYRMQLRVEDGEAALKTRKGLDWTDKVPAHRQGGGEAARRASSTARSSRSITTARRISPRCRRRLSDGKTDDLIFFAFDLLFAGGEDLRALPLAERKARLKQLLERAEGQGKLIRYVEHFESDGDAVLQSACKMSLEGIVSKRLGCALSLRPHGELDQGQVPRRP